MFEKNKVSLRFNNYLKSDYWKIISIIFLAQILLPFNTLADDTLDDIQINSTTYCMADAWEIINNKSLPKDAINCTANDVEITDVTPIDPDTGNPPTPDDPLTCQEGGIAKFDALVKVQVNALARWDGTFYLPRGPWSPQQVLANADGDECDAWTGEDDDSGDAQSDFMQELDGDTCGDFTKAPGPDNYTYMVEDIEIACEDADESGFLDFNYCAAWDNQAVDGNCPADGVTTEDGLIPGQVPNTKSKCKCDIFDINIVIVNDPPGITKTLISDNYGDATDGEVAEPSGKFLFEIEVENKNAVAEQKIASLADFITSSDNDGSPITLEEFDLTNGSVTLGDITVDPDITNGCGKLTFPYTLAPLTSVKCRFEVTINDDNLRDLPTHGSELFKDFVRATITDTDGKAIGNNDCTAPNDGTTDDNCSNEQSVQVVNLSPTIKVTKTVDTGETDPTQLPESDSDTEVTYTVKVENLSGEPVTISELLDIVAPKNTSDFSGTGVTLSGDADCQVGTELAKDGETGDFCEFSYSGFIQGNSGDYITNQVTAKAKDNENDEANDSDTATVTFVNSPGMIDIVKTANDTSIPETGQDVIFTFEITNTSSFDPLTLTSLSDNMFGIIFDDDEYNNSNEMLPDDTCNLFGTVLQPGDSVSCTIKEFLQGEPGAENAHTNVATVKANTDDEVTCEEGATPPCFEEVMDMDDETVDFENVPADVSLSVDISATLFITITNNSSYESVNLTKLQFLGADIAPENSNAGYRLLNDGGSFNSASFDSCVQPSEGSPQSIAASGEYKCAFTVELINNGTGLDNLLRSVANGGTGGIEISVIDPEGGPADTESVKATVQLVPTP